MGALTIGQETGAALKGFNVLFTQSGQKKASWPADIIQDLTAKLLTLRDSPNDLVAEEASGLIKKLKQINGANDVGSVNMTAIDLIQQQLNGKGHLMPLFSLINLAVETYNSLDGSEQVEALEKLLPTSTQWEQAIAPFMSQLPHPALAITSPLGGLLYLVTPATEAVSGDIQRDEEDISLAFRLGLYVTSLVSETKIPRSALSKLDVLQMYLPLVAQLTNDKITLETCNTLWLGSTPELLEEGLNLLDMARKIAEDLIYGDRTAEAVEDGPARTTAETEKDNLAWKLNSSGLLSGSGPSAYHYAEAFSSFNLVSHESYGLGAFHPDGTDIVNNLHSAPHSSLSGFWLPACREEIIHSTAGRKILNELIAEATSLNGKIVPIV